jgi:carboxyl-terminal processing protease
MKYSMKVYLTLFSLCISILSFGQSVDEFRQNRLIESTLKEINDHYVKEVDGKVLTENGINRIFDQLDPFSELIPPDIDHSVDELQTDGFGGLGIRVHKQGNVLNIVTVLDGTPADRMGLMAGDEILQIDSVDIIDIRARDISKRLRGKPGTTETLLVKRWGIDENLIFNIIREHITVPIITYSGMLEPGVAYIKFSKFSKQSSILLEKRLREFEKNQMKWLILDLRSNPGGLLHAAIEISDLFLPERSLVVETKGRIDRLNHRFYTHRPEIFPELNLIILMDRSSASASEILAGVLQDYERAIIIGTKSYGKGLVQSVIRLPDGYRIKMTTAHYYLPSGRLIQRQNFAQSVVEGGINPKDTTWFETLHGRTFQQGDGILPDLTIAPLLMAKEERILWQQSKFYEYALELTRKNTSIILPYEPSLEVIQDFREWSTDSTENKKHNPFIGLLKLDFALSHNDTTLNDSIMNAIQYLSELDPTLFEDYIYEIDEERIKRGISMETGMILAGTSARIQASLKYDLVIEQALELIHHPDEVKNILSHK